MARLDVSHSKVRKRDIVKELHRGSVDPIGLLITLSIYYKEASALQTSRSVNRFTTFAQCWPLDKDCVKILLAYESDTLTDSVCVLFKCCLY